MHIYTNVFNTRKPFLIYPLLLLPLYSYVSDAPPAFLLQETPQIETIHEEDKPEKTGITTAQEIPYKRAYIDYFKTGLSGFLRYEGYFDTRQVIGVADDDVIALPKNKYPDPYCHDIYANGQFNQTTITTRLRYFLRGPDMHCAKSSLFLETDFFGGTSTYLFNNNGDFLINLLRMRHSFITLDWCKHSVIAGYTWHPLYVFDCFPNTMSFAGGAPVAIYARSPQLRLSYYGDKVDLLAAAISQLDFSALGPIGLSTTYLRHAIVPELHAQIRYHNNGHTVGLGLDFKRFIPRLVTNKGYKANEYINSGAALAYYTYINKDIRFSTQVFYVQNGNDVSLIGGFAVHSINPITDHRTYTNLSVINWWADLTVTHWKHGEPGIFIGYSKNLGSRKTIIATLQPTPDDVSENLIYSFGQNTDNTFIIAPRFRYMINQIEFNGEILYTLTHYGLINNYGRAYNTHPVSNTRIVSSILYYF